MDAAPRVDVMTSLFRAADVSAWRWPALLGSALIARDNAFADCPFWGGEALKAFDGFKGLVIAYFFTNCDVLERGRNAKNDERR